MANFYDISSWNESLWFQPGGTRNKVIIENPNDHSLYYFKTSLKREKKDYKYEFWSEIIASEIGKLLGFDMLVYDIAYNRGEIGCLSKSMVIMGENTLNEGIKYLTGYDTTYNPEEKDSKKQYTFQFICETLKYYRFGHYVENIIELIILDCIIGNGDRHQENWGIVTEYRDVMKMLLEIANQEKKGLTETLFSILGISSKSKIESKARILNELKLTMPGQFSQIYDSGSCLGREIEDDRIQKMLSDEAMLNSYINRGVSEIHWEGEKLSHFDLISRINNIYPEIVWKIVMRIKQKFDKKRISGIIQNVDLRLPELLLDYKLPQERKDFILKLIVLRVQKLITLIG
jgi:hypothetical protein